MTTFVVPYHLDERLPGLVTGFPVDRELTAQLPPGTPWQRMAVLYGHVAEEVAAAPTRPLVVSGDCTTGLGVLTGLQRAGRDPGIVWFDAHADFHTEATTTSGYLGGMPLALAAGVGTPTLPDALGLRPVPPSRVVLVDARDTDPPEHALLERAGVRRRPVAGLGAADLPDGELYLHVDLDVCDPADVPDLLFPASGGPPLDDVLAAVGRVLGTGRVAAVGLAATWRDRDRPAPAHERVLAAVRELAGS
ncbi:MULTISPECIES: arginase family protein [unclassified Geodermatophilus]